MQILEPYFRNDFNQIENTLQTVFKKEIEKKDGWKFENFRPTLTIYNGKTSKTFSYPFGQNAYKVKAAWASSSGRFDIHLFWYQFHKKEDGIDYFDYEHIQHENTAPLSRLNKKSRSIPQTTEEAKMVARHLIQTGGAKDTQFIKKNKLSVLRAGKLIFSGDHRHFCNGPVNLEMAESYFKILDKKKCEGIFFNNESMTSNLEFGTCSAMTIKFAERVLSYKAMLPNNHPLFFTSLKLLERDFKTSSEFMRDLQAAMNTIEVDFDNESIDFSKNKVQSILNFSDIVIDSSSEEFDLNNDSYEKFRQLFGSMPDGVYFIRILEPSDNNALEAKGHSLLYIVEPGHKMLYDPNYGLFEMDRFLETELLFGTLKTISDQWNIHLMRFYLIRRGDNGAKYTEIRDILSEVPKEIFI
jgi:hypothetical protein